MHIAFVSTGYYPTHSGGASVSTQLIVEQLRAAGHTVDVFTTTGEGTGIQRLAPDHVELPDGSGYTLPERIGTNYGVVKNVETFSEYDVVHVYGFGSLPGVVLRSDVPVLATANNLEWVCINWSGYLKAGCPAYGLREAVALARQDGYGPVTLLPKLALESTFKRLAKRADHMTVQTVGMKQILTRCGYAEVDLSVVPNLLDPRFVSSRSAETHRVIYVGRLIERKGADDVVRAFVNLPGHLREQFDLRLYGNGPLEEIITEELAGQEGDVQVTYSPYEELPQEYQKASVLVHGSKYPEPFSRTWLEAMASETAIVCSRNPSSRTTLDGIAEFYDPFDRESLQQSLEMVLREPARRSELATAGKAAVSQFEPQAVVPQYISRYHRIRK